MMRERIFAADRCEPAGKGILTVTRVFLDGAIVQEMSAMRTRSYNHSRGVRTPSRPFDWACGVRSLDDAVPGGSRLWVNMMCPRQSQTAPSAKIKMMKSKGEIEAAICDGMSRFEQEYMGRGPKDIHAYLIDDLVVVRLTGVLTVAEQHLVRSLPPEKGRDLLKQVRTHLIETARPLLETMMHDITGAKMISLHHDISTATGEEVVAFTLDHAPDCRETRESRDRQ